MTIPRPDITTILALALAVSIALVSGCSEQPDTTRTGTDATEQSEPETARNGARAQAEDTPANASQASLDGPESASPVDPEMCGEDKDREVDGDTTPIDLPTPEASEVIVEGHDPISTIDSPNTLSNAGEYRVTLESVGEIRVGDPFEIVARIEYADGRMLPSDVTASADAYMPRHFHGMNVASETERTGNWEYTARNMAFHMTGLWEVYIDISELGVTERAQFTFEVK